MRCLNELALFAGAGGGLLASKLLGWNTICGVELAEYPRNVLLQRQRDGMLEPFPVWDDVCTFNGRPWRGKVDVISGGFPCQDISAAGKGAGITGERSGLWKEYLRIIGEVRPEFVFAENSPLLRTRGLGVVIKDLDGLGYDVRWGVLGSGHIGAVHKRARMWLVAHSNYKDESVLPVDAEVGGCVGSDTNCVHAQGVIAGGTNPQGRTLAYSRPVRSLVPGNVWRQGPPDVPRMDERVPNRVDRFKAIGNAQVPAVAATAFRILSQEWI